MDLNNTSVGNVNETTLVSALGAFIACTVLALLIVTGYMSFRVYIKNKK